MLYFLGYPLTMVINANFVMYFCYMGIEVAYLVTAYILADNETRRRIKNDWWLFVVMPIYRFTLFWFRFGGFISVLMEPAEWRVQDPVAEVRAAFAKQKANLANIWSQRKKV
jgi:hypothetical protein